MSEEQRGSFDGGPLEGYIIPLVEPLPIVNDPTGTYTQIGRNEAGILMFKWVPA